MIAYPSEELLTQIKTFKFTTIHEVMDFIKPHWCYSETGFIKKENTYTLHTFGWSGNKEIIDALQKNVPFWFMFWQESKRGGHYKFSA